MWGPHWKLFLSVIEAVGVPRERITRRPTEVFGSEGNSLTLLALYLDLTVVNEKNIWSSYYWLILRRAPLTTWKALDPPRRSCSFYIPSMFEGYMKRKESPFQRDEGHFSEAAYFDELAEEWEVAPARCLGIPLSAWEDLEGQEAQLENSAFTSTRYPSLSKQHKPDKKKKSPRGDDSHGEIRLAHERTHMYITYSQTFLRDLSPLTFL